MDLFSFSFSVLIIITLICYYLFPKKYQWIFLLIASLVFYFFTGTFNFLFILFSSISTFCGAKFLNKYNQFYKEQKSAAVLNKEELKLLKTKLKNKKRIILFIILLLNFGILACLKYWNTIVSSINEKCIKDISFLLLNKGNGLLLPLGISFYTFQAVGYILDVYNEKYVNENNFFKYLLFLSFFPLLIQGPINRYDKLGKELSREHAWDFENIKQGFLLFIYGAMKKYTIAETLVICISKIFDSSYDNLPGSVIVFGILLYSAYQYADFSGGIDMVLGIAKIFGINMQPNFRQPYFSTSLADFWRRWHISLGLWMKDYVFYPFALTTGMQKLGKKCSKVSKHFGRVIPAGVSNILVFLIVGIWHGPEMHYVLWGLYNGLVIALSDGFKPLFTKMSETLKINTKTKGFKLFQIIRTFIIVNIGWYFDRIYDISKSFTYLKNTFSSFKLSAFNSFMRIFKNDIQYFDSKLFLAFVCVIIVFIVSIISEKKGDFYSWWKTKNIVVRWSILYLFMILFLIGYSLAGNGTTFMYALY